MMRSPFWRFSAILCAAATLGSVVAEQQNGQSPVVSSQARRVAIIGAGAAGTSTAYHLRKFASEHDLPVDITVFERADYVGGRTTTVKAYGNGVPVELGGSIFVDVNEILKNSSAEFGLRPEQSETGTSEYLGIWDGDKFVFTEEESEGWKDYWNIGKMLWKYGLAPVRTQRLSRRIVKKFSRMYEAPAFPFRSLTERAQDLDLVEVSAVTGEELLLANSIAQSFGTNIIQASTRVNYGQNLRHVNGLISMVCMAIEGAMQIEGGNWQIFDRMLTLSNATVHLNTSVTRIAKQDNMYHLKTETEASNSQTSDDHDFDTVVLASPFQFTNIDISEAGLEHVPDKIPYVRLHVTLFASPHTLNPVFFGLRPTDHCPDTVLTTLQPEDIPSDRLHPAGKPNFFSISTLRTVVNPHSAQREYLYKIFSPEKIDAAFLSGILGTPVPPNLDSISPTSGEAITWYYPHVWDSYPFDFPRVTFEELQLAEDFYYTSSMDTFISTMETNALMGKNVARLVVDDVLNGKGPGERVGGDGDGAGVVKQHTEEL